jgi:ubiquinone/menaquinone biosynthesis C-methylase UbiE
VELSYHVLSREGTLSLARWAMSETDKVFAGSIPEIYDAFLVPLIFEGFADDLARRVASGSPRAVLESAAGSGVLTRALAGRIPPNAQYVATDLNRPILDQASRRQDSEEWITWQQANALSLPFPDHAFDAVCCQFGVMFFPDRIAAYREAHRVLALGGRFAFNVWDRIEENVFADNVTKALANVFPDDPPLFLARTPHGYHDVTLIRHELEQAGFRDIVIETLEEFSRAPSPKHPAVAYCQGTPLRNEIEARDASRLDEATERAADAIALKHGAGGVAAKIRGHVITAAA